METAFFLPSWCNHDVASHVGMLAAKVMLLFSGRMMLERNRYVHSFLYNININKMQLLDWAIPRHKVFRT